MLSTVSLSSQGERRHSRAVWSMREEQQTGRSSTYETHTHQDQPRVSYVVPTKNGTPGCTPAGLSIITDAKIVCVCPAVYKLSCYSVVIHAFATLPSWCQLAVLLCLRPAGRSWYYEAARRMLTLLACMQHVYSSEQQDCRYCTGFGFST